MKTIKGLRWWIIALVCLGTITNYLARNSLGVLAPQLKTELGMSTQQYSYVVGAFQVGYTIMQPVCGFIVDLIGLRIGFAVFAVLWSIAGCLHAGASGWLSLASFRGLMGLTEAAAIPSGMKAVAEWFPDRKNPSRWATSMRARRWARCWRRRWWCFCRCAMAGSRRSW